MGLHISLLKVLQMDIDETVGVKLEELKLQRLKEKGVADAAASDGNLDASGDLLGKLRNSSRTDAYESRSQSTNSR